MKQGWAVTTALTSSTQRAEGVAARISMQLQQQEVSCRTGLCMVCDCVTALTASTSFNELKVLLPELTCSCSSRR